MKTRTNITLLTLALSMIHLASAGTISGKVTLKGTHPKERTIIFDPICGKMHDKPVTTRHYLVGADKGLANVFVYIKKGLEGKKFSTPAGMALLDQKNCLYEPFVMGIQTDQPLVIQNSDANFHNVRSTPLAFGNKAFNFAQVAKGQRTTKSFSKQEVVVRFKCDIHQWMFAYVAVVEHPFFAVTDAKGNFKLEDVPAGEYEIEAYHVKTHYRLRKGITKPVTLTDKATVDFTIELKAPK